MDKRTLLAVVLSVVVISLGFMIQNILFPPAETAEVLPVEQTVSSPLSADDTSAVRTAVDSTKTDSTAIAPVSSGTSAASNIVPVGESELARMITVETEKYEITFSTEGGVIDHFGLKEHTDGDQYVEMVYSQDSDLDAFEMRFGGPDVEPINDVFTYRKLEEYKFEFSREYAVNQDGTMVPFTLIKTYTFLPNEYMFKLDITINNSVNEYPALTTGGFAYTLTYGPQIGPTFEKLDGRFDFRKFYIFQGEKKVEQKASRAGLAVVDEVYSWGAVVGKYFATVAIPDSTPYTLSFSSAAVTGVNVASQMNLSRPAIKASKNTDSFLFYVGPKSAKDLSVYNNAEDNIFGVSSLQLDKIQDTSSWLGWLETILKFMLKMIYKVIPNYGFAIIILTLIVKIVLYPITHKSYESTGKMQALSPKINELKEKYGDNKEKLNAEMAELYKREKVNPMGGCLPMLLQFPFFIAMYGLFNKHFDLRGAHFFGWINDLAAPDSIWSFAPTTLPLIGSDLRVLPILMVATQLLSSKVMQAGQEQTSSAGGMNTKMMMYFMPIFFFFILYNSPSGLLLYWIVQNVVTTLQQVVIKRIQANKKA